MSEKLEAPYRSSLSQLMFKAYMKRHVDAGDCSPEVQNDRVKNEAENEGQKKAENEAQVVKCEDVVNIGEKSDSEKSFRESVWNKENLESTENLHLCAELVNNGSKELSIENKKIILDLEMLLNLQNDQYAQLATQNINTQISQNNCPSGFSLHNFAAVKDQNPNPLIHSNSKYVAYAIRRGYVRILEDGFEGHYKLQMGEEKIKKVCLNSGEGLAVIDSCGAVKIADVSTGSTSSSLKIKHGPKPIDCLWINDFSLILLFSDGLNAHLRSWTPSHHFLDLQNVDDNETFESESFVLNTEPLKEPIKLIEFNQNPKKNKKNNLFAFATDSGLTLWDLEVGQRVGWVCLRSVLGGDLVGCLVYYEEERTYLWLFSVGEIVLVRVTGSPFCKENFRLCQKIRLRNGQFVSLEAVRDSPFVFAVVQPIGAGSPNSGLLLFRLRENENDSPSPITSVRPLRMSDTKIHTFTVQVKSIYLAPSYILPTPIQALEIVPNLLSPHIIKDLQLISRYSKTPLHTIQTNINPQIIGRNDEQVENQSDFHNSSQTNNEQIQLVSDENVKILNIMTIDTTAQTSTQANEPNAFFRFYTVPLSLLYCSHKILSPKNRQNNHEIPKNTLNTDSSKKIQENNEEKKNEKDRKQIQENPQKNTGTFYLENNQLIPWETPPKTPSSKNILSKLFPGISCAPSSILSSHSAGGEGLTDDAKTRQKQYEIQIDTNAQNTADQTNNEQSDKNAQTNDKNTEKNHKNADKNDKNTGKTDKTVEKIAEESDKNGQKVDKHNGRMDTNGETQMEPYKEKIREHKKSDRADHKKGNEKSLKDDKKTDTKTETNTTDSNKSKNAKPSPEAKFAESQKGDKKKNKSDESKKIEGKQDPLGEKQSYLGETYNSLPNPTGEIGGNNNSLHFETGVEKMIERKMERSIEEKLEKIFEKSMSENVGKYIGKNIETILDKNLPKPFETTVHKAMEKTIHKHFETMEKKLEKSLEKSLEKYLEKYLEKSIENYLEKSVEKSVEKAVGKSLGNILEETDNLQKINPSKSNNNKKPQNSDNPPEDFKHLLNTLGSAIIKETHDTAAKMKKIIGEVVGQAAADLLVSQSEQADRILRNCRTDNVEGISPRGISEITYSITESLKQSIPAYLNQAPSLQEAQVRAVKETLPQVVAKEIEKQFVQSVVPAVTEAISLAFHGLRQDLPKTLENAQRHTGTKESLNQLEQKLVDQFQRFQSANSPASLTKPIAELRDAMKRIEKTLKDISNVKRASVEPLLDIQSQLQELTERGEVEKAFARAIEVDQKKIRKEGGGPKWTYFLCQKFDPLEWLDQIPSPLTSPALLGVSKLLIDGIPNALASNDALEVSSKWIREALLLLDADDPQLRDTNSFELTTCLSHMLNALELGVSTVRASGGDHGEALDKLKTGSRHIKRMLQKLLDEKKKTTPT